MSNPDTPAGEGRVEEIRTKYAAELKIIADDPELREQDEWSEIADLAELLSWIDHSRGETLRANGYLDKVKELKKDVSALSQSAQQAEARLRAVEEELRKWRAAACPICSKHQTPNPECDLCNWQRVLEVDGEAQAEARRLREALHMVGTSLERLGEIIPAVKHSAVISTLITKCMLAAETSPPTGPGGA